jgi:hypothetical protein
MTALSTNSDRIVMLSLGRKSRVVSVTPGGDDMQVLIEGLEAMPDGVAVDPINRHLYYTFMGAIRDGEDFWENDGYIERANFDGSDRTVIVPAGTFVTGKQIQCDAENGRLYWSDREGLGVMSCRLDGSDLTIHVRTGSQEDKQDRRRHCVGVAVDPKGGFLYWTQKGKPKGNEGKILRAPLSRAPDMDPAQRTDIEVLFDGLPEPIDLEWDGETETLYWTDRGDPPSGNTLNRATIHNGKAVDHKIILSGLQEAIGLALDHQGRRIFVSDLKGSLWMMSLDRPGEGNIIYQSRGPLTGIAYLRS